MTQSMFSKVTFKPPVRLGILAPSGSGKTFFGLALAQELAASDGGRVAVIDTESGSASLYFGEEYERGKFLDFDSCPLDSFHPRNYIAAIKNAQDMGYKAILIDSLSHAWIGKDGLLQEKDNVVKRSGGKKNDYTAWGDITPIQQELVDTMLACKIHLIVTMRVNTEYVQEKDPKTGKTSIRKVGLKPQQRDGLEYEFSIIADMNQEHDFIISKTRCRALDGYVKNKPSASEIAKILIDWRSNLSGKDSSLPEFQHNFEPVTETTTKSQVVNSSSTDRLKSIVKLTGHKGAEVKSVILAQGFPGVEKSEHLSNDQCSDVVVSLVSSFLERTDKEDRLSDFLPLVGTENELSFLEELVSKDLAGAIG